MLSTPDFLSTTNCSYNFGRMKVNFTEIELKNQEEVIFEVPSMYHQQPLNNLILSHRKNPKHQGNIEFHNGKKIEQDGSYTRVFVLPVNEKSWVQWKKDKYAEVRSEKSPEIECLFEWYLFMDKPIDKVKLVNVSKSEKAILTVHGIELQFLPMLTGKEIFVQQIFTKGSMFAHLFKLKKALYGGGKSISRNYS
jgi:hypothetical protein